MRRAIWAVCAAMVFSAGVQASSMRVYFSTTGLTNGQLQSPPPEYTTHANPVITPGTPLYLFAAIMDPGTWVGISLNYSGNAGPVGLVNSVFSSGPVSMQRWNTGSDFVGQLDGTDRTNTVAISINQECGLANPYSFDADDDLAVASADGAMHYYLGAVTPGEMGNGFLHVGPRGIARMGGNPNSDLIYLGWGDAGLHGNQFGAASAAADFVMTPEVGSGAGLAVLVALGRRRAG